MLRLISTLHFSSSVPHVTLYGKWLIGFLLFFPRDIGPYLWEAYYERIILGGDKWQLLSSLDW